MTDGPWRIELDETLCSGMGDCARIAPDVVELDADGMAVLRTGTTDDPMALEAVRACPMAALRALRASTGEQVA
jgi:ferredoxin